jgi:hypothetical protein
MTPITRQDVLAHQAVVPWAAQYQVEQDLLLCRAMVALFEDKISECPNRHARRHALAQSSSCASVPLQRGH